MTRLSRFARSYPLVAVTLAVLALVLGLHADGLDAAAAVIATVYVAGHIAWAAVGMVREVLRGHFGLDILAVVRPGDELLVKPNEVLPVDAELLSAESDRKSVV